MKSLAALALTLGTTLGLTLVSGVSHAADCPVDLLGTENYLEEVSAAINKAPNCYEAASVAESCALGASGDSVTTSTAVDKCSADVLPKLSKLETEQFNGLMGKCGDKYKDMQGTMYISAAGFCRLSVSRLYYELYMPVDSAE